MGKTTEAWDRQSDWDSRKRGWGESLNLTVKALLVWLWSVDVILWWQF